MSWNHARRLAVLALAAVFAFGLGGCWNPFAPDEGDPSDRPPEEYRLPTTPANVIHNMELAYKEMNVDTYLDCLSEDFIFYPNEEDVGGEIPEYWFKDEERRVHTNMFSETPPDPTLTVESIDLTLTQTVRDSIEGSEPGEWNVILQEGVDLRVNLYSGTTYLATAPSEYRLRRAEEVGPNGETLWEIYEWWDLEIDGKFAADQNPGVETVSLTELKSTYLD
jgi:hypothetical protein